MHPTRLIALAALFASAGGASVADKLLSPFGIGSCYVNNRSAQDNAR